MTVQRARGGLAILLAAAVFVGAVVLWLAVN